MSAHSHIPKVSRSASAEHEFHTLGSRSFERFACALHGAQPDIQGAHLYGPDGQPQFGADHIAFHRGDPTPWLEVGQSKAHRSFGPAQVRKATKDFTDHWDTHWAGRDIRRFVLFVGCTIKSREATDEIIRLTIAFAALGVELQVWDAAAIYDRLASAPAVVRTHLGQDWYSSLFGEPVGPLTGLVRELQLGDQGALVVGGYVARLNQAEGAELVELRRRFRRGEGATVVVELEAIIGSPTARATAPEVLAGQMRMLAGLLIRRDADRARALLDEADALDGTSERQRYILLLETVGAEAALAAIDADGNADLAEIRAIAHLRLGAPGAAFDELTPFADAENATAETLRIAAIAKLAAGERAAAVAYAERAVRRDPDARACRQSLAICLYHAALSDVAEVSLGEWPQPVDMPLIRISDQARRDLEAAERMFGELAADPLLEDNGSMLMWQLGALACMPWRRDELADRIAELEASGDLPIPMIGWCVSRGLPLDDVEAARRCDARIADDPGDFETLLIRVALANHRREHAVARRLIDDAREALTAAGHAEVYSYWSSVLDLEKRRVAGDGAVPEHPWLRFRVALDIRNKKTRLKAISTLLERELAGSGDPRVILASAQLLLDGGWHRTAVKAAPFLIGRIATGEAIAVGAHALYREARYREVLEALGNVDAFPGGRLPADLERLRTECQAGSGELVAARSTSLLLAQATAQPRDIWRSIELHIATGAEPAALAMYEQHADRLNAPTAGHLLLANAVASSNPDAAARIARQIAAAAPDELVSATFSLASRLRLDAEQRTLASRMTQLGADGNAGVQALSMEQVVDWINARNLQMEEVFEKYANGHLPVHLLAGVRRAALPLTYLQPLLEVPVPAVRTAMLSTRYGRRYDEAVWPDAREDTTLLADVTALLTAHGLDVLDTVERAFAPIFIAPDTLSALLAMRNDVELPQPSRVAAARIALAFADAGDIVLAGEPQTDGFTVLWEDLGETSATLNLSRLIEQALAAETTDERERVRIALGTTVESVPAGAIPPIGSLVVLDSVMLVTLGDAGALDPIRRRFTVATSADDMARLRGEVTDADARERIAASLVQLSKRLAAGLDDGTYRSVPVTDAPGREPVQRSFLQLLDAMRDGKSILWIDDRFASAIDSAEFRVATTVETMTALRRHGRLHLDRERALRQQLRAARWMFMPLDGEEIAALMRPAVRGGEVIENGDLAIMRRSMGEFLRCRRRLQWPDPAAAVKEVRGEVPFLLDRSHAVAQALAEIWNDVRWTVADAAAASRWIVDHLEMGLFPLPVLAPGDARSDHVIGTHLGGLVLVALQIRPGRIEDPRQGQYLRWLADDVVRPSLRVRPEFRASMEEMIEKFLVGDGEEEDARNVELWRTLAGKAINAMPDDIRVPFLLRDRIRREFDLPGHGVMNLDRYDFDEMSFWRATANATTTGSRTVQTTTGEIGEATLVDGDGVRGLTIAIGETTLRLDAWPWEIASGDSAIRTAAVAERADVLDLSEAEAAALAARLAELPAEERGRHVLGLEHAGMSRWYRDFEEKLRQRVSFQVTELAPDEMIRVPRLFRFDGDLDQAAERLISDRGLATALRRLGGLPVGPPPSIRAGVASLDPAQLAALLDDAQLDTAPPWTQLWVAALVLARPDGGADAGGRAVIWLDRALASESDVHWRLYSGLARFMAREGSRIPGWLTLSGQEQLLTVWGHASAIAEVVSAGNVRIEPLINLLQQNRFVSPRLLVEPQSHFSQDRADPVCVSPERLKAYAAFPALLALANDDAEREKATAQIRALVHDASSDPPRLRVEVAEGGLRQTDALGSLFSADWSIGLDSIESGLGGLFGTDLIALAGSLLDRETLLGQEGSAWPFLRMICGDAAFPADLALKAREASANAFAPEATHGPQSDTHVLLAFARIAGSNGWSEHIADVEEVYMALDIDALAQDDDGRGLIFELAMARSMLEPDPLERTRVLGRHFTRLGRNRLLRHQVEKAALQFARGLSGQLAEAFVDTLGDLMASV